MPVFQVKCSEMGDPEAFQQVVFQNSKQALFGLVSGNGKT